MIRLPRVPRRLLLLVLVLLAFLAILEGLWAIDFAVSVGHCTLYFPYPGYWERRITWGTCVNLRYYTIVASAVFLATAALWHIFRSPPADGSP